MGINWVVTGLCIGAGFGLVMTGLFLPHEATRIMVSEVLTGGLAIVSAVMAATSAQRRS